MKKCTCMSLNARVHCVKTLMLVRAGKAFLVAVANAGCVEAVALEAAMWVAAEGSGRMHELALVAKLALVTKLAKDSRLGCALCRGGRWVCKLALVAELALDAELTKDNRLGCALCSRDSDFAVRAKHIAQFLFGEGTGKQLVNQVGK